MLRYLVISYLFAFVKIVCAKSLRNDDTDIINGFDANPGDYPWFVKYEDSDKDFICGGSLVWGDIVLTAAHCIAGGFPEKVRVGATDDNDGTKVVVSSSQIHSGWDSDSKVNDVALLILADFVEETPVVLNSNKNYPSTSGMSLITMGYGETSTTSNSNNLKVLNMQFVNNVQCEVGIGIFNEDAHVCADYAFGGICYGDSGGPLVDNSHIQIGVTSFLRKSCASEYPDVFARVSTYIDWIDQGICDKSSQPPTSCAGATSSPSTSSPDVPQNSPTLSPAPILTPTLTPTLSPTVSPSSEESTNEILAMILRMIYEFIVDVLGSRVRTSTCSWFFSCEEP